MAWKKNALLDPFIVGETAIKEMHFVGPSSYVDGGKSRNEMVLK